MVLEPGSHYAFCPISSGSTSTSGIHFAVFAERMYHVLRRNTKGLKFKWFLVSFIWVMFATGAINLACTTRMTQLMFIDNRAFPGGPNAWFNANYSNGANTAGNAAYIIANFFADSLLVSTRVMTEKASLMHATAVENVRSVEHSVGYRPACHHLHGLNG